MKRSALLIGSILLGALVVRTPLAAHATDSLAYSELRQRAVASASALTGMREAIDAADELAVEGFFDVAFDLLDATLSPGDSATSIDTKDTPATSVSRRIEWVISSSGDYNSTLDSSSYDTLWRDSTVIIDDHYYSGKLQASMIWRPGIADIQRITPTLYISESRLHGDVRLDAASPGRYITGRVGLIGEKRLLQDYGDSSDLAQVFESIEFTSRPAGKPLSLSLPVDAEAAWFRVSRPGYASYVDARVRPELELSADSVDASAALFCDVEYKDYAQEGDSADVWSYCPGVSGSYYGEGGWISLHAGYEVRSYPHDGSPTGERRIDLDLTSSLKTTDKVRLVLDIMGANERSTFSDTVFVEYDSLIRVMDTTQGTESTISVKAPRPVLASYALGGWNVSLTPALNVELGRGFSFRCGFGLEVKRYPLLNSLVDGRHLNQPLYLWESMDAYEPELSAEYASEPLRIKLGGSYRIEDIKDHTTYYLDDSRTWRVNGDVQWQVVSWISAHAFVEYQSKALRQDTNAAASAPSTGLSVSASVEARF